jgi:hypothetical protein
MVLALYDVHARTDLGCLDALVPMSRHLGRLSGIDAVTTSQARPADA